MYFGRRGPFLSFRLGMRPFGISVWRPGTPDDDRHRAQYADALEEYRRDLEQELRRVDSELASLRGTQAQTVGEGGPAA